MEERRQFESVRRNYTEQQLRDMNEGLVQAVGDVKNLRGEKASAMSTIGAAVKQAEARVFDLQEKISLGYEVVDVEVLAVMDEPEPGKKKIIRADTSEVLRVELMSPRERQQSFGFGIAGEDPRPE
jgi:hypothetical protein